VRAITEAAFPGQFFDLGKCAVDVIFAGPGL
jgi:hypothetical protein